MPKKSPKQFPRNYRKIPEYFKKNPRLLYLLILSLVCSTVLLASIFVLSRNLILSLNEKKMLEEKNQILLSEEKALSLEVIKYPNRDSFYNLAVVEYGLGKNYEARVNLEKALNIDPNFQKGIELEKQIGD